MTGTLCAQAELHNLMSDLQACRANSQPLPEEIHAQVSARMGLSNIRVRLPDCLSCMSSMSPPPTHQVAEQGRLLQPCARAAARQLVARAHSSCHCICMCTAGCSKADVWPSSQQSLTGARAGTCRVVKVALLPLLGPGSRHDGPLEQDTEPPQALADQPHAAHCARVTARRNHNDSRLAHTHTAALSRQGASCQVRRLARLAPPAGSTNAWLR